MDNSNIISVYTRQNAIDDGIFVDVSEQAKSCGFIIPVALTRNLFSTHIEDKADHSKTAKRLNIFLLIMYKEIREGKNKDSNMLTAKIHFDENKPTEVWAIIEAQSPTDPSPAMNIMLPEDY